MPPNSLAGVWPTNTAPASFNRAVMVPSWSAISSFRTRDASVWGQPLTGSSSLTPMGTPPKGSETSAAAAVARACSSSMKHTAFSEDAPMAVSEASRASVGEMVPARNASTSEHASSIHGWSVMRQDAIGSSPLEAQLIPPRPPPPYSVVRRLKRYDARGAATARMATDHSRAASTGCCMGQTWTVDDGLGLPKSTRHPAVTALTGFQSAMAWSHPGMWVVGTRAFEMKARGNSAMNPNEAADSGPLLLRPTKAATQER